MSKTPRHWFRAKRYGWGWGLPCAWQGWAVLVAYLAIVATVSVLLEGCPDLLSMTIGAATLVLVGICLIKGEPPRWRWGEKSDADG